MDEKTTITLKSSDDVSFDVSREVAMKSETIAHMLDDIEGVEKETVPLPNVKGAVLAKVIEYCSFHVEAETKDQDDKPKKSEDEIKTFDTEYMKVDQSALYDLILAANYLNIASLLDLCCQSVAYMIKGKSPEEIRRTFNIKNDFTEQEEEEVRRENLWAFD